MSKRATAALAALCFFYGANTHLARAGSFEFDSDFSQERTLPAGFSNELNVTPAVLAALVAQATGSARIDARALTVASNTNARQTVAMASTPSPRDAR